MKKYLLVLVLLISYVVNAEIIKVDNLDQIEQDFTENYNKNYLPQDILVVVAIDKLLFEPLVPMDMKISQENAAKLMQIYGKVTPSKKDYTNEVMLVSYPQKLQYLNFPNFIKTISNANISIIALTNGLTGNFNNIPKLEIWLADYLKKNFDIDFSRSFPKNNYLIFNNLTKFDNTYPVFYKGILSSNNTAPDAVLLSFLIQVSIMPKALIIISSDENLLKSTDFQINSYSSNINYVGYHLNNDQIDNSEANFTNYIKFINDLVAKINKVQRNNNIKNNKQTSKNPYDNKK